MMRPGFEVPVVPDADAAREAARAELADPAYQRLEPTWFERASDAVLDAIGDLLDSTAGAAVGGWWTLAVGAVLAVGALVLLRSGLRPGAGQLRRRRPEVFGATLRSAAEHHRAADAALGAGDVDEAVRERFRALVRGATERGVLDVRASRTADEAAAEIARMLPATSAGVRSAARIFDRVHYGGHRASAAEHHAVATAAAQTASAPLERARVR
ncbi:MAG: DUF4129 domain-containing protein [Sporichthyaceae bacterium]